MMYRIHHYILSLFIMIGLMSVAAAALPPMTANAACPDRAFLTFPTWYRGLDSSTATDGGCRIGFSGDLNDFWKIPLNVIEILLQVVGYASVGYLIWGGFKYIKSQGNSSSIGEAKQTIMNALIGLGIALASVAIVNFIAEAIK